MDHRRPSDRSAALRRTLRPRAQRNSPPRDRPPAAPIRPVAEEALRALRPRPARSSSPHTCVRARRPAGSPGHGDRRLWKRHGSVRRKETAAALARQIHESPACRPNRPQAEAGGRGLLAHGMQEVVGSSPTSSTRERAANRRCSTHAARALRSPIARTLVWLSVAVQSSPFTSARNRSGSPCCGSWHWRKARA